ncbi:MAG: hypothetical protein WAZ31_09160, partial [Rectinemataceae bacterium]
GHPDVINKVIKYLQSQKMAPIGYVDLEKPSDSTRLELTMETLSVRIKEKLVDIEALSYFIEWENMVSSSSSGFVNEISSILEMNADPKAWSGQAALLLGNLYGAYSGTDELSESAKTNIVGATLLLNQSYMDNLDKAVVSSLSGETFPLIPGKLSGDQLGKINSKLFFDFSPPQDFELGSVFFPSDEAGIFKAMLEWTFNKGKYPPEAALCGMIVTPSCDLAWGKYLKTVENNQRLLRILWGICFPVTTKNDLCQILKSATQIRKIQELVAKNDKIEASLKKQIERLDANRKSDSLFCTEPFWFEEKGKNYMIIFHYGSLSSKWFDGEHAPEIKFAINEHLVFDIQSKMANHANRLGNFMLPLS